MFSLNKQGMKGKAEKRDAISGKWLKNLQTKTVEIGFLKLLNTAKYIQLKSQDMLNKQNST